MSDYRYHGYPDQQSLTIERGFEPGRSYAPLESECFIRIVGIDNLICLLCDKKFKLVSGDTIDLHRKNHEHQSKYEILRNKLLDQLPKRDTLQMTAMSEYLHRLYQQQALHESTYEVRDLIINQFILSWQSLDNLSTFRIHGSHLTKTSLTHSNINLEIVHPNGKLFRKDPRAKNSIHHKLIDPDAEIGYQFNYHLTQYDLIANPIEVLYKMYTSFSNYFSEFHVISENPLKDMMKRVPKLTLRHVETGTILDLTCYDDSSYKQSELLKIYMSLDDRVRKLACLVKYWANICSIDKPDRGTYPPETYLIMIIYYLQRTSPPILPCLHEMFPHICQSTEKSPKTVFDNQDENLNQISDDLKNISLISNSAKSAQSNGQSDPISESDSSNKSPRNHLSTTITPTADQDNEPVDDEPEDDDEDDESSYFHCNIPEIDELIRNWVPQKEELTVQDLFIQFMQFMKHDLEVYNSAISIRRSSKHVRHNSKNTLFRTKMIEDPIKPKLNISRCIGSYRQMEYVINCFKRAYYYLTSVPLNFNLRIDDEKKRNPQDFIRLFYNEQRMDSYFYMKWYVDGKLSSSRQSKRDNLEEMINQQLFARDVYVINALFEKAASHRSGIDDLPRAVANAYQKRFLLPPETESIRFCWLCKSLGHARDECSNFKILTLHDEIRNYDINLDSEADLDEMFWEMYNAEAISPQVSSTHEKITQMIHGMIQRGLPIYDFELTRFGSTVNNLGSVDSDIDICLTIRGNETGVGIDCVEILRQVSQVLESNPSVVHDLEAVLTARVPIIRFKFRKIDIDLSMYNHCALYNSELLRFYSTIDERVPILAYLVKKIAKVCRIADASRGSLSSYGWSLLVIHYLQHIDPPILPVLQEPLPNEAAATEVSRTKTNQIDNKFGVQGWNVWFRKDLGNFEQVSRLTVTELFKGFFLYYGCFDWDAYVVSIRSSAYIPRYKKSWNNSIMAIEDPFELTYNLAYRLDDAMSIYIINTLVNTYRHIVRAQRNYLDSRARKTRLNLSSILFSSIRSINGSDPPWRGCRVCHRIGHRIKDCPEKRPKITQTRIQNNYNSTNYHQQHQHQHHDHHRELEKTSNQNKSRNSQYFHTPAPNRDRKNLINRSLIQNKPPNSKPLETK